MTNIHPTEPTPTTSTTDLLRPADGGRASRRRSRRPGAIVLGAAAVAIGSLGFADATAGAQPEPVDDLPAAADADPDDVDVPDDALDVFVADVRVDGLRVDEEWIFAFGPDDRSPRLSSLWLLVDRDPVTDDDDWAKVCTGWNSVGDEGSLFLGRSLVGDRRDGCVVATLGDEPESIRFAVIELEGDSSATAALYPIL
ncbi:MAG: hypothetical protein AAFP84_07070 [Actinomycetota bacterium]